MQITGIILAGGKSLRMGTDKTVLKINDKTILERATELIEPFCNFIIISSNNPEHKKIGFKTISDEILDCGPIGGIYSCLKQSETNWNFIFSVDSVFVEPEFVKFLISEIDEFDAVVPTHLKGKEPLIALYRKNSLIKMEKMIESGNFKMHNLINSINTKFIESQNWMDKFPKLFYNLNRPEDFNAYNS